MANTPAPEAPAKVAAAPAPAGPGKLTLSNPGSKTAVKARDNSKAPLPVGTSGTLYVVHN